MNARTFQPTQAHKLEDPERLRWLPPAEVLALLRLRPGMCVCDLGAGSGYFALPLAREVGPYGKVFAVDFQADMLDLLRRKLAQTPGAPANIEPIHGHASQTHLPNGCTDVVLAANLWHELEQHDAVLTEIRRVLHPEGRLALLDWRHDVSQPPGPPLEHRIPIRQAIDFLERHGWSLEHHCHIGSFSYMLIGVPADDGVQS